MVDALGLIGEEGRDIRRYASGNWKISYDPEISEWDNPLPVMW
jgi:hypothetical protein